MIGVNALRSRDDGPFHQGLSPKVAPMDALIGTKLGQYEILSRLGEGGMATVYRARQTTIQRDVAVKVIKTDFKDIEDFAKRFDREAQTSASLSHPHILKIFDYGRQGDLVYLVMELVARGSLDSVLRRGVLSTEDAIKYVAQVGSALDYAHSRGVIHRDLKPSNVLLDEQRNAILTDFGIAKVLHANTRLTQTGAAVGTPAYMSPEQWKGEIVDGRADQYMLAVMAYEMLTGRLPFEGDTSFSLMTMHVMSPPPAIHLARPDLPINLDFTLGRALAKNPDDRFSSAGEFVDAFKQSLIAPSSSGKMQTVMLADADQPSSINLDAAVARHFAGAPDDDFSGDLGSPSSDSINLDMAVERHLAPQNAPQNAPQSAPPSAPQRAPQPPRDPSPSAQAMPMPRQPIKPAVPAKSKRPETAALIVVVVLSVAAALVIGLLVVRYARQEALRSAELTRTVAVTATQSQAENGTPGTAPALITASPIGGLAVNTLPPTWTPIASATRGPSRTPLPTFTPNRRDSLRTQAATRRAPATLTLPPSPRPGEIPKCPPGLPPPPPDKPPCRP